MTDILEAGKSASESDVLALEKSLNIKLPEKYRNFLLKYNGGRPVPDSFNFKGKARGSNVDWFLGTDQAESNNLIDYLRIYKNRIPQNFFPIASDSGDNLIGIAVSGADRGKIYFWDYEQENDSDEAPDYSNLILISDDFDDFINNLHEIEI